MIKIHDFQGELTDMSAKTEAVVLRSASAVVILENTCFDYPEVT